jgi:DNA-binding CsgD family transcriptional regulator/tetratricopeptide (TPR) repeat protein
MRLLRGRYREALTEGKAALAVARAAGDRRSESEVLNTLGMAQISVGDVDEGISCLREAIDIATEDEDIGRMEGAYTNLADSLNLAGRTLEALDVAKEAIDAFGARGARVTDWMLLTAFDMTFETGDWKSARRYFDQVGVHPAGRQEIFRLLRGAEVALGVGDEEAAVQGLEQLEPLVARSPEPQWIGAFGTLKAECLRRRRDLEGARDAVANALDRIELCTDDVARIARVTAAGMRVEADIAQRARDLREKAAERDAIARARIHMSRLRAAAQDGGPVEAAWEKTGAGELARARGRSSAKLWLAAASAWDGLERPYPATLVRFRAAEAEVDAGDRDAAAALVTAGREVADRLGARWLVREFSRLADRARLRVGAVAAVEGNGNGGSGGDGDGEDPFGLTARERQVLGLIAAGATNRQIGASLYMAEKTASVHVSRILRKLGVGSRTQAAAVAHRMGLD